MRDGTTDLKDQLATMSLRIREPYERTLKTLSDRLRGMPTGTPLLRDEIATRTLLEFMDQTFRR